MFQTIGAYLDTLLIIGAGVLGRSYIPRLMRKGGAGEEAERRVAQTRKLGTGLIVLGLVMLILRLLGV